MNAGTLDLDTVAFAKALADDTRQQIMTLCCCDLVSVNDIAERLDVGQPTVSHHLKILKEAGLVRSERRGKQVLYTLIQEKLAEGCCQVAGDFAPSQPVKIVLDDLASEERPTNRRRSMSEKIISPDEIRKSVRDRYSALAEKAGGGVAVDCGCGTGDSGCCGGDSVAQLDQVAQLYEDPDALTLPDEVTNLSLGCGDPVTLAALQPGETVLDLGSGGGIDCFLAAKKVGLDGKVIGVDMTPAMIDQARANKSRLGAENVQFRLGEIEHLPVEDSSVDVILSNCVINLSPDKGQVFREAFRVLRPGGKLAVSDIVTDGDLPEAVKQSMSAWAGCVAGAMNVNDYVAAIETAGFVDVEVQPQYWGQDIITEVIDQLEPEVRAELDQVREEGRPVVYIQGEAEGGLVEPELKESKFDPQKAVYSARFLAYRPMS